MIKQQSHYMKPLVSILSALALSTTLAFALDEAPGAAGTTSTAASESKRGRKAQDPEKMFKKLDGNADGSVTLEEFKTGPRAQKAPERAEALFKRRDADGNGSLTLEELKTQPERGGKKKKKAQ